MSKNHYIVNCYTCQHNGQETCKGCRTLLVGEDKPYENWQLREDLEQKDNKIDDLEAKLAESENKANGFIELFNKKQHENYEQFCEIEQLKQQLAEKEEELEDWEDGTIVEKLWHTQRQLAEKEQELKQLKFDLGMFKSVNEFINSYGIEKAREVLLQTEKTKRQDKISFCIEKLTEVREYVKNCNSLDMVEGEVRLDIVKYIRLKIEELNQLKAK